MMSENQTLLSVIKRDLAATNYPVLISGSLMVGIIALLMSFGAHPEIINSSMESHLGFMFSMAGIVFLLFIGAFIGLSITYFYKPMLVRYTKIPDEIDNVKNGLIGLGSYVTTLDVVTEKRKLAEVLLYILRELKKRPNSKPDLLGNTMPSSDQTNQIIDDISFKVVNQRKELDKFQKTLDEFSA